MPVFPVGAYLFFLTIFAYLAAALFHGRIRRDELLDRMARCTTRGIADLDP